MFTNNPTLRTRPVNVHLPLVGKRFEVPRNVLSRVGTGLKVAGAFTAVIGAVDDINKYRSGEISGAHLTLNLVMNGVGFIGPIGAGVSILYGLTEDYFWSK